MVVLGEHQDCFENTDIWGLIPQCIQLHGMETPLRFGFLYQI